MSFSKEQEPLADIALGCHRDGLEIFASTDNSCWQELGSGG